MPLTNAEFGSRVGIHHSAASRIRNGKRRPSGAVFVRIVREFDLDATAATRAFEAGEFGAFIEREVFQREDPA